MTPSSITFGMPPTLVETTGNPVAIASGMTSGSPSKSEHSTNASSAFSTSGTSRRTPSRWTKGDT